jgi:hypothetical protein
MATITLDLIADDPKNDEFVIYLVENGPWEGDPRQRLQALQKRLYDAFDVVTEGVLASKYPESKGRRIRIQVDSHKSPPETTLNLVRKFATYIYENDEYRMAIRESPFVADVCVVNGTDIGRCLNSD